jgi:hypothetical protein
LYEYEIMATIIRCSCGKKLRIQEIYFGHRVRCPACGAIHIEPCRSAEPVPLAMPVVVPAATVPLASPVAAPSVKAKAEPADVQWDTPLDEPLPRGTKRVPATDEEDDFVKVDEIEEIEEIPVAHADKEDEDEPRPRAKKRRPHDED